MATRIRLRRVGRKKQPLYRIVVTDRQKARDGLSVETLGHYNPRTEPATIQVDVERARAWLAQGATPSETVRSKGMASRQSSTDKKDKIPLETVTQYRRRWFEGQAIISL